MFKVSSPKGSYCQICPKPAILDIYFYGDDEEDAIRRYNPTIRVCKDHLEELQSIINFRKPNEI